MSWLSALFRRKPHEKNLDSELSFHLEQQIRDNIAGGMDPEQARREAAIEFGGLEQIKEECRDVRTGKWIETTIQDVRYGVRSLRKTPGFTFVALVTIAVGIGANTAIFSFVDAVLIRPLPFPDADRIVTLGEKDANGSYSPFSTLTYLDWANLNSVFESIAAERYDEVALTGTDVPVRLNVDRVSAHYFDIFRVRPALGRTFADSEDQVGRDGVAVLSNKLWVSQFGADASVLGRTLMLDGKPTTVIGVLPPGVMDRIWPEIYRPLAFPPETMSRDSHWLQAYAMLKPGVTAKQAHTEMQAISKRIANDNPKSNKGWGAIIIPYAATQVWKELRQSLEVLLAAVGVVLLIACANLANLTLARGLARKREVAVRAALGAGRWRLFRQFLTESLLLSLAGGTLGALFGYGAMAVLKRTAMPASSLPYTADVAMDKGVLCFALGLSALTGIVFGLIPALKASRTDISSATKDGGFAGSTGLIINRLRGVLVVSEVALAFVLLSSAGLFIRSFLQIQRVDVGFDPTNLATAYLPIATKFPSGKELNLYLHQIVDRVGSIPGVTEVALTTEVPRGRGWGDWRQIQIVGTKESDPAHRPRCGYKTVTPSYFRTMGMRLSMGRLLNDHDISGSPPVTVISESMAKTYFPGQNPVGQHIRDREFIFPSGTLGPDVSWEVVGVVADERNAGLREENSPGMYVSDEQSFTDWQYLVVRAGVDPSALDHSMRVALREVNREQVMDALETFDQIKSDSMGSDRHLSSLVAIFACLALALAGLGLYGVMSYSVAQQSREIGIRSALGATTTNILGLVVGRGMRLAFIGLIIGFAGALGISQFLNSMLFNVGKYDPATLVGVASLLSVTSLLASYIPARRAMKVNPIVALRYE